MTFKEIVCGKAAVLYTIPKDNLKTDYLSVVFTFPPIRGKTAEYALIPALLACGSEKYPTHGDFSRQLDTLYNAGIGCRTGKSGERYQIVFQLRCLETQCVPGGEDLFSETVAVFADMLLHPALENGVFRTTYVEREKKNLCDAIRSDINNKAGYALKRLDCEMFREETYGIPVRGTLEEASAITPTALYDTYRDMLAHAPVTCHYVGKLSAESVAEKLRPLFAELDALRCAPYYAPETEVVRQAQHPVRVIREEQPTRQSRLCIGYRTGAVLADGDYYKFALFNELLGGSASSKLFLDVREVRGLCYDISSFPEGQKGILYISCGISADAYDEAKAAIDAQIAAIRDGDISDAEFSAAKKSLCAGYREIEDGASSLAAWYANRRQAGIDTSPAETAAQVMTCTKEDVAACAARLTEDTVFFMCGTQSGDADGEEDTEADEYGD